MTTTENVDLNAMLAEARAKEAKAMADMFLQPAVCRMCGAQVVIPEAHKAFHDGIESWMKDVMKAFEVAGFETREQRANRHRVAAPRRNSEDGAAS